MKRRVFACAALVALAALSARALSLVILTDARIVELSDRIVVGTVTSVTTKWMDPDRDGTQSIYTVATFRIDDSIKGTDQRGTSITLHVFGGTIGNQAMAASGIPLFNQDERLLLCLTPEIASCKFTAVIGAVQGRWVIHADGNGQDVARREYGEAAYFNVAPDNSLVETFRPKDIEEPLSALTARLKQEVAK